MKFAFTCLLFFCLIMTKKMKAQTFFEGTGGKTSINLPLGGLVRINTADRSLKIGYYYNRSDKQIVFGIDASGKSNNGFAPIVSSKKLSPDAHINFNVGLKNVATSDLQPSRYDYLNIKAGIGAAHYLLLNPQLSYNKQIHGKSFIKANLGVSYNYLLNGKMIFGIYAGYERSNNISRLPQLTIKETTKVGVKGANTRTAETEYTVWKGSFKTLNEGVMYLDYVYIPDLLSDRIALSAYSRSMFSSIHNITNGGFGLYFNRKGKPLRIIGGLIYEFDDLFNAAGASTSLVHRGTLGLVAGYNF
jgi:hypothetical protein